MIVDAHRRHSAAAAAPAVDATALVRRALRDPAVPFDPDCAIDPRLLIGAAERHRVLVLLGSLMRCAGTIDSWPSEFVRVCTEAERRAAAVDCLRHSELAELLSTLNDAGVRVMPFKGAALAYTHYSSPHLRERSDADLLIPPAALAALEDAVRRLGYQRQHETSGRLVSYQSHYVKRDRHGIFHAIDVHWKVSNRQMLADRLTFDELWDRRVAVPALGPTAAAPAPVHALLLALLHRAGHHPGSRDLLWIYDMHLLAARMTPEEIAETVRVADARRMAAIAREGLTMTAEWFATPLDGGISSALDAAASREREMNVGQDWGQAEIVHSDLMALPTWRARGLLLREHLFPAPEYMRQKYGVQSTLLLPALYAWRVVAAAPRWLRKEDRGMS